MSDSDVGLGGRGNDHIVFYSTLDSDCRIAALCDVNQAAREKAVARVLKAKNYSPKEFADMREVFASKDIDAVSLPLPITGMLWRRSGVPGRQGRVCGEACLPQHFFEGARWWRRRASISAWSRWGRKSRSIPYKMQAIKLIREGAIGTLYQVKGVCYRRRFSIGHTPDEPVPAGVDWDKFLGPAQFKPYSKKQICLQLALVLGHRKRRHRESGRARDGHRAVGAERSRVPKTVMSTGGKFVWKDARRLPTQSSRCFNFGEVEMTFEVPQSAESDGESRSLPAEAELCGKPVSGGTRAHDGRRHGLQDVHELGAAIEGEGARGRGKQPGEV